MTDMETLRAWVVERAAKASELYGRSAGDVALAEYWAGRLQELQAVLQRIDLLMGKNATATQVLEAQSFGKNNDKSV